MTVNARLQDRAIRHATYLERLKASEVRTLLALLDRDVILPARERLIARTAVIQSRGFDRGPWTTKRLATALAAASELGDAVSKFLGTRLNERLEEIGLAEAAWQVAALQQTLPQQVAVFVDLKSPSLTMIRASIRSRPFQGRVLRDWARSVGQSTKVELSRQLRIGLANGESTQAITRRFDGALRTGRRHAETIARTAVTHVAAQAHRETFRENADVVEFQRFVATLDSRTSPQCSAADGRVWPVGEGLTPPLHPRCRSVLVPITKPIEDVLGVRRARKVPEETRASMSGQVPASLSYGQWLRQQPAAIQDQVLGKGKARLFRENKLQIERFVDSQFRPLTLDEVLEREGLRRLEGGGFGPK